MQYEIENLAVHYIERNHRIELAPAEVDLGQIAPGIRDFFEKLINGVLDIEESKQVYSAVFAEREQQATRTNIESLIDQTRDFFEVSIDLARSLHGATDPRASTGLLAVIRIRDAQNRIFVVLLKIENKDGSIIHLAQNALTQITLEEVQNLLTDEIQKAAIFPHPTKTDFQLKVIDNQRSHDPAKYFSEDFLGAVVKKSDKHQVTNLLSSIRKYAEESGQEFFPENSLRFIIELRRRGEGLDPAKVAAVARDVQLFGREFDISDFREFITSEEQLGDLKISAAAFANRKSSPRLAKIRFLDGRFRGVEISGPPDVLERLITTEGDSTKFAIQTSKGLFIYEYE